LTNVIGDITLGALVIALNPIVIILAILLVLSKRGRTNSFIFLAGWFFTLLLIGWFVLFLAEAGHISASAERTTTMSILKLLFGILFLILASYYWKKRPAKGKRAEVPSWMNSIDNFTGRKSLTTGITIAGANPKNIGITIAAALEIALAELPSPQPGIVIGVFALICSLPILTIIIYRLIAGKSAEKTLNSWKAWLGIHNATVLMVVLLTLGVKWVVDSLMSLI
jgi:threonine/homoserine/homoserine lactone efflux protein